MHVLVCPDGEFQCDGTRCIPKSKKCDKENDCSDQTDEQNCPRMTGKSNYRIGRLKTYFS